jgi:hypothetical protein
MKKIIIIAGILLGLVIISQAAPMLKSTDRFTISTKSIENKEYTHFEIVKGEEMNIREVVSELNELQKKNEEFVVLLMIPLTYGICCQKNKECVVVETCQDASCGNCTFTLFNRTGSTIIPKSNMKLESLYSYSYNVSTSLTRFETYPYAINCTNNRVCKGDCQVELKQECEEQEMNGLAITNAMLFILPFKINFSKSEILNHVLKRSSIVIGLFFLSMNTAIVATIAESSSLEVVQELLRYLWLINWSAYIAMGILVISTLMSSLELYKQGKLKTSLEGPNEDELI